MARLTIAGLIHALPAIIISTIIQLFIGFAVGWIVMEFLMPTSLGHNHPNIVLCISTMAVIGSFAWMKWNHLVFQYIETRR